MYKAVLELIKYQTCCLRRESHTLPTCIKMQKIGGPRTVREGRCCQKNALSALGFWTTLLHPAVQDQQIDPNLLLRGNCFRPRYSCVLSGFKACLSMQKTDRPKKEPYEAATCKLNTGKFVRTCPLKGGKTGVKVTTVSSSCGRSDNGILSL